MDHLKEGPGISQTKHAQSVVNAIGDLLVLDARGAAYPQLIRSTLSAAAECIKLMMTLDDRAPAHMPSRSWAVVRAHEMRYAEGSAERVALAALRENLQEVK